MSPYAGAARHTWPEITKRLVAAHPLKRDELRDVVLEAWGYVRTTEIGSSGVYLLQKGIRPSPQTLGNLLHRMIEHGLATRYPHIWKGGGPADKDMVHQPEARFSIEIKTTSQGDGIYGNRSYGQKGRPRKSRSGYVLSVVYRINEADPQASDIHRIRFGWLDREDWVAQKSETGQQSRVPAAVRDAKMELIYKKPEAAQR